MIAFGLLKFNVTDRLRLIAKLVLVSVLSMQQGLAQTGARAITIPSGRQFYGGDGAKPGLIRIHVLGGVAAPGKYFVTPQTDLFELVSLAGGINSNADPESILLRRRDSIPEKGLSLNLRSALEDGSSQPFYFKDNDVILVNTKDPVISPELALIVNFTASVLAATATLFLLKDRIEKK
jgi:hypothetical protein